MVVIVDKMTYGFQSTLPRGERPVAVKIGFLDGNFNPLSHEGSDFSHA